MRTFRINGPVRSDSGLPAEGAFVDRFAAVEVWPMPGPPVYGPDGLPLAFGEGSAEPPALPESMRAAREPLETIAPLSVWR